MSGRLCCNKQQQHHFKLLARGGFTGGDPPRLCWPTNRDASRSMQVLSVPECTKTRVSELKNRKKFWGQPPLQTPLLVGRGHPSPHPTPSHSHILAPTAIDSTCAFGSTRRLCPRRLHSPPATTSVKLAPTLCGLRGCRLMRIIP